MSIANQPSGGATIQDAVSKLNGILSEPSEPTDSQPVEAQSTPEPQSQEPETHTDNQSDTEAPSRRRKAKLGEREIEFEVLTDDVDLDLIPKGLMMENDYRQKTMSHAENVKAFEAKQSEFDTALADLQDSLLMKAEALESDEMKELKELDPDQYWKKFDEVKGQAEKLKAYKEKRDSELLKQQQEYVNQEAQRYTEMIPEWLDDTVKTKDVQSMVTFLGNTGFSEQEIGSLYDSRMMSVVRKAALYDQISSQNIEAKRVHNAPKSSKPSSTTQSADKTSKQKSFERLKQTGRMSDAQSAIKNLILGG